MSALCVEGSGVADTALEGTAALLSKGKGILGLFIPAHGTAVVSTIRNSRDLGCCGCEVCRNSLQHLAIDILGMTLSLSY